VAGVPGTWGDAVLKKTPIRMYMAIKRPLVLKRVFKKSTQLTSSRWMLVISGIRPSLGS